MQCGFLKIPSRYKLQKLHWRPKSYLGDVDSWNNWFRHPAVWGSWASAAQDPSEEEMETQKKLVQTTDASSYPDLFRLSLLSYKIPISLHTQDFPFSQQWVHCFSPLSDGWVWCCEVPCLRTAESQGEMSSASTARTLYGFHSSLVFRKNFHKVVPEEENSQPEPLGRMWLKFGFPKEGACEPQRAAAGTHLVWQPQFPGEPSEASLWGQAPAHIQKLTPKTPWVPSPAKELCTWARTAADGLFIKLICQHDSNFNPDFMYWPIPSGNERGTGHKCDRMLLLHDTKEEQLLGLVHHFILWASFLPKSSQNNFSKIMILLMVQENEHKRDGERCLKSLL